MDLIIPPFLSTLIPTMKMCQTPPHSFTDTRTPFVRLDGSPNGPPPLISTSRSRTVSKSSRSQRRKIVASRRYICAYARLARTSAIHASGAPRRSYVLEADTDPTPASKGEHVSLEVVGSLSLRQPAVGFEGMGVGEDRGVQRGFAVGHAD